MVADPIEQYACVRHIFSDWLQGDARSGEKAWRQSSLTAKRLSLADATSGRRARNPFPVIRS